MHVIATYRRFRVVVSVNAVTTIAVNLVSPNRPVGPNQKKAVIPCSACGRFLCALCDVEFNGRHLCPACLETGKRKRKIKNLENHRTLYDTTTLFLAILPMVFCFWVTLLTAPMVLFLVIRYWKAPTSIVPRTKIRFVSAFVIASLQIVGWSVFFFS